VNVTKRKTTVEHLRRQNAPHLASYLLNPAHEFHLSYDLELARDFLSADDDGQRRIDAARDRGPLPAPPEFATIGSNGVDDDGYVHWIGFDIDAKDHAGGHDDATIERIAGKLKQIPWVQLNRSRGGQGLHGYIPLATPIRTVGRKVSGLRDQLVKQIASEIGEPDFPSLVDDTSGMMFFWSPNLNPRSYELLKPATAQFEGELAPPASTDDDWFNDFGNVAPPPPDRDVILSALRAIKRERADDYKMWLKIGMILKTLGDDYLSVWTEWSQQSKQYRKGDCEAKWPTFKATADAGDVTAATLFKWVEEDTPTSSWIVNGSSFIKSYHTMPPQLLPGLVHRAEVFSVIGGPKCRKSYFIAQLALAIASGTEWLGYQPAQGRVLLADNELLRPSITRRLQRIAQAMGIDFASTMRNIDIASMRDNPLDIEKIQGKLCENTSQPYTAIFIDALYKCYPHGVDENSNADMMRVFSALSSIATQQNATVFVTHHFSKGKQTDKAVSDIGSGGGAQSRATDCHMVLLPHKESGHLALHFIVREFATAKPIVIRDEFPLWVLAPDKNPDEVLKTTTHSKLTLDGVVALLTSSTKYKDFHRLVKSTLGGTKDDISLVIEEAVKRSLIGETPAIGSKPRMLSPNTQPPAS
jgi:AAA domain-containing protein/primase-like protein